MPMWAPPTPPHDDNDIYIDQSMFFLYEPTIMPETQLPPIHVKKEHKKPKIESITTRKQKQRKEEQPRVPRSLFDRPTAVMRMRRDAKLKQGLLKPFRPVQPQLNKPTMDPAPDHPEWLIHEDWALLQAVQSLFDVPLNLMVVSPAHIPNWDLVADVVSSISRVYRSAKQCKNRYENVIIPREEGRILYDINPRKQSKKTKGIYKTKNNRPMRTSQLYVQDSNNAVTMLHSLRFESVKSLAGKRPPTLKQTLVNPTPKHSKHAAVLSESGIIYDNPRNPMQVAEIRAQRIQREKKQNQAAAQATAEQQLAAQRTQAQQSAQQTVTPSTPQSQPQPTTVTATIAVPQGVAQVQQAVAQQLQPIATTVTQAVVTGVALPAKTAVGQTAVSLARTVGAVGTGNIVVNTPGAVGTPSFAAINRRISQATAQPVTVGAITPAIRTQRGVPGGQLTIQEITAITSQAGQQVAHVATGQVARSQIQTTVPSSITTQLARIASTQATTISAAGVPAKTYTQQQLIALQQRQLVTSTNRALLQQQQPRKLTPEQLRQQQQLKQLQARSAVPGQKQTVITASQHLVTSLGQVPKQGQVKTTTAIGRQVPQELLLQQQKLSQKAQVQVVQQPVTAQLQQMPTTQIIQAQVHQVGQPAVTTAVKTVSAAPTGIQIPVSQLQQQKAGVAKATINPLQPQLKQMQLIGQRKQALQQPQKITSLAHPITKPLAGNTVQIIQQPLGAGQNLTYQLQQIVKRNPSSMIITSQPTIIATVTQSQQPGQQYKVLSTSNTQSSQLQTITAVSTPQPVTHATGATSQPSVATLSMAVATPQTQVSKPTVVSAVGAADPTGQTVQVHSVSSQQPKIATISHVVTTQPLQQIQVTPATLQQVHTTNVVQPSSSTAPSTVTVTVAPSTQSPLTATLIQQTAHSSPQTQQVPATQGTQQQVQNSPQTTAITQTVVPMAGTVTSQAALAAASALPQGVAQQPQVITGVVQQVTQATAQQVVQAQSSKAAPYAMRTRNPPKH